MDFLLTFHIGQQQSKVEQVCLVPSAFYRPLQMLEDAVKGGILALAIFDIREARRRAVRWPTRKPLIVPFYWDPICLIARCLWKNPHFHVFVSVSAGRFLQIGAEPYADIVTQNVSISINVFGAHPKTVPNRCNCPPVAVLASRCHNFDSVAFSPKRFFRATSDCREPW